jgi:hypothetical protein
MQKLTATLDRIIPESFEERERRQFAMEVLDSHELLMRHAHSAGDVS